MVYFLVNSSCLPLIGSIFRDGKLHEEAFLNLCYTKLKRFPVNKKQNNETPSWTVLDVTVVVGLLNQVKKTELII